MTDGSFAKAGLVGLAVALAALQPVSAPVSAAPLLDGVAVFAQQDQGTTQDQTSGGTNGQSATDTETLDNGPAFTNEPSPAAQGTIPAGQPDNDVETLDNGPATTNEPPLPASQTTAAPATSTPAPSGQAPSGGQQAPSATETAAPAPTQAAGMTPQQFFAMPHSCVIAQAGRAFAAVNCDPNAQVVAGFAPLGQTPPFGISTGSTGGSQSAPAPPPSNPQPTATPTSSSTGSAQSNSPTTKQGKSGANANANGASTQSSQPVVTFSGPQGTVKRVGNATIVTGASQDSQQQAVHNANGTSTTSDQSGGNNQTKGNLSAAQHGKKHGKKHGKNGKHKKHKNNKHHKNSKGKAKKSNNGANKSGRQASAGNGGSARAEANGGSISVGAQDAGAKPEKKGQSRSKSKAAGQS